MNKITLCKPCQSIPTLTSTYKKESGLRPSFKSKCKCCGKVSLETDYYLEKEVK